MRAFAALFLGLTFSAQGWADGEKADPRPDMHAMAAEVMTLEKYLVSDAEFSSPDNQEQISKSLTAVGAHLAHLGKGAFAQDPFLKVNLSLLQQHMRDADRAFHDRNKAFARYMVQSSLQMCIECHTRRKTPDFALPQLDTKGLAPLDLGDYLFATRQFQKGKEVFEKLVDGFPQNAEGQWNLRKALLSLAVYYARVKEDPQGGKAYFAQVAANEKIPEYVREESGAWSAEFGKWAKETPPKEQKLTETELLAQARKLLKNDDLSLVSEVGHSFHVRRLRATVVLQKILESPGDKSPPKAEALLLLGQIYPRLSSNLFFRFGDMYLKACITDYPKTSVARSCYVALELSITEGYSGTAGTDIPDDEQVELLRLKRLAY